MAEIPRSQPLDPVNEEKPPKPEGMKDVLHSAENEMSVSANSSQDATFSNPRENMGQSGSFGAPGDRTVYPPAVYAPQARAFTCRGYDNTTGEWEEYPAYVNAERLEIGSPGLYNDNPSLVFHSGYGCSPQMPYGPYSPVATPLPSIGGDAQLYPPQQYPFSPPPYFQQLGSPSLSYISSTTPVPHPEPNTLASIDQHGDSMLFGPRPSYPPPLGSFGRGSFSGNFGAGFPDLQRGLRSGGLWSDWSKPSDRYRPLTPLSPAVTPQPIGSFESFSQNAGMASQQQRSVYGLGSGSNSYNRAFLQSGYNLGSSFGRTSFSSFETNCRHWLSLDNSRWRGRGNVAICGCNGDMEQNRGPRASKPKSQNTTEHISSVDINKNIKFTAKIHDDSYNQSDFATEHKDAKLFIIKSYSEDNVHKCIKYGVWASTQNGNKKLDTAYHEAKKKENPCPVFLFFSVNGSAQFCGVAEMAGPVDFDKSVNYWQQDKWSGQFPVKWHIIKDVPNSQFRHIILENNDNKPVTNSRDTQEVKLEQGIEMLNIFKNHETDMSILDDFDYYEGRQKAMQERRAKQQASLIAIGAVGENNQQATVNLTTDFIKQMSKSFAQEVCLDDSGKDGTVTGRAGSDPDGSMDSRVKLEHGSTAVSSAQTS